MLAHDDDDKDDTDDNNDDDDDDNNGNDKNFAIFDLISCSSGELALKSTLTAVGS